MVLICSSALLGYGLEALVDVWSSVLVLWRFWNDPDGEGQYFLVTRRREQRASVGIAVTFILIGFFTCWQVCSPLVVACLYLYPNCGCIMHALCMNCGNRCAGFVSLNRGEPPQK